METLVASFHVSVSRCSEARPAMEGGPRIRLALQSVTRREGMIYQVTNRHRVGPANSTRPSAGA